MKKIETNYEDRFDKYVRLYLDDMIHIYEELKNYKHINIKTNNYELDSVTELEKIKENKIHNTEFFVNSETKNIADITRIHFQNHGVIFLCGNKNYKAITEFNNIKKYLDKKASNITNIILSYLMRYIALFAMLASGLNLITELIQCKYSFVSIACFILSSSIIIIQLLLFILFKKTTIVTSYKKNKLSFFKRNSDKILVAVITTFISIALTLGANAFYQTYTSKQIVENSQLSTKKQIVSP